MLQHSKDIKTDFSGHSQSKKSHHGYFSNDHAQDKYSQERVKVHLHNFPDLYFETEKLREHFSSRTFHSLELERLKILGLN